MRIKKISNVAAIVAKVIDSLTSTSQIDALSANQGKILNDTFKTGWLIDTKNWVFNSNTNNPEIVISTTDGDFTSEYNNGMKIKLTNSGNLIYGIITKVGSTGANTVLTILSEINPSNNQALYLLQNSAITNVYVSRDKTPLGFPMDKSKWCLTLSSTSTSVAVSTGLVRTPYKLSLPTGAFDVEYLISLRAVGGGGETLWVKTALSQGDSNTPYNESIDYRNAGNGYGTITKSEGIYKGRANVNNTTKQDYYILCAYANSLGNAGIFSYNESFSTIMKATCSYL